MYLYARWSLEDAVQKEQANQKRSVAELHQIIEQTQHGTENGAERRSACYDALWRTILAFENEQFVTMRGLDFTYQIKRKRNGEKSNEIVISRKKKTITRSTVEMAFDRVTELSGVVKGPKKIGTFGASYIYAIFLRFGLILPM